MKLKTLFFSLFAAMLLAIAPGIAFAWDENGQFNIFGIGGNNCAKIFESPKKDNDYLYASDWIAGFMTATSFWVHTKDKFGNSEEIYDIMLLIRQYCNENPHKSLAEAAFNVGGQLTSKAKYR